MLQELKIKRNSGQPVSEQIATFIKSKIKGKGIKAGTKLPTTQEFMSQFGVGSNTIRQAISSLKEEGLVRAIPRLGTIVNETEVGADTSPTNGVYHPNNTSIAVAGLLDSVDHSFRFRADTAQGIIRECERLGVSMVVLPSQALKEEPEALYNKLMQQKCKGLVCVTRGVLANETIDYLLERGIEVVSQRRFRHKDGRSCIESDYDGAGYDVGIYFYSQNCDKVVVFSHYELTCEVSEAERNAYTLGLKHGVYRAFESKGIEPDIDFCVNKSETSPETIKAILSKLGLVSDRTGILFTNGYQLLNLFKHSPDKVKTLLSNKKITVISNKTINQELEVYVAGLDLMVLLDPYQEIGSQMVSKLFGILGGYLSRGSTTLADIKFVSFHKTVM